MSTESKSLFIPSLESTSHYVPRTLAGGITEDQMYDFALDNKMNILIEGDAGTGKTTSFMNWCAKRHMNFFAIPSNSALDFTQLIGGLFPDADGKLKWVDGAVTQIVRNGGGLLINELNNAHKSLAQYLMSLGDDRRSITIMSHDNEVIKAHENFILVADQNPNYRNTQLLNEAWKDRFEIKVRYDYDSALEKKFIKSGSLLELAQGMRATSRREEHASDRGTIFETPVSPRILKTFERLATGLSYDFASDVFINNFADEERPAVKMLLEGMSFNIKEELGISQGSITTEYDQA